MLTLDHVFNNGGRERRNLGGKSGVIFYTYLKKNNFPDVDRYQVLCANCNLYIMIMGEPCYHKRRTNGNSL